MSIYALTSSARADIFGIWSYIARESEEAADRVERAIYNACALVADNPMLGRVRKDLTSRPVRFWNVVRYLNYVVVYRPNTSPVEIVVVLHGRQNIRSILRKRLN